MTVAVVSCGLRCGRTFAGRAFTLAELLISTAATTILVGGMVSAIVLATRALPENGGDLDKLVDAAGVAERITSELQCARSVTARSARMIEFTVADQTGDGQPDLIRYEWSGNAGEPLQRQYNGGATAAVLDDVAAFGLAYDAASWTCPSAPSEVTSEETLLASYDSTSDLADLTVKTNQWPAQYFTPTLPGNALGWRVTRVLVIARGDGDLAGVTRVQLRSADGSQHPTATVLAAATLADATLPSERLWREFTLSGAPRIPAGDGVCLVLQRTTSDGTCKVRYQNSNVTATGLTLSQTINGGASWQTYSGQAMLFHAYGTVTTGEQGADQIFSQISAVRLTLRVGNDTAGAINTAIQLLNRPEVAE